jgi:hypothetical protein
MDHIAAAKVAFPLEMFLLGLPVSGKGWNSPILAADHPCIIHLGNNNAVLDLDHIGWNNKIRGMVARIHGFPSTGGYRLLGGSNSDQLSSTISCLREMGFQNISDYHEIVYQHYRGTTNCFTVYIYQNLTEDGKYRVQDAAPEAMQGLANGRALEENLESSIALLHSQIKAGRYDIEAYDHLGIDNDTALRRMFFLKIAREANTGELVIEDLDHLKISKL